jgi:predicted GNAT family N-acyltransferase
VAHGTADLGGKLIGHAFGLDFYERLPMYGKVGTESGLRAIQKRRNSPQSSTAGVGSFFEIRHPKPFLEDMRALDVRARPRSALRAERPKLETRLAATPDEIAKVFAIRAAVFLAEQGCPYDEEFDGNDYAGAHVLGLVNGEPAAVLRVRYFAEFVKLERLAVLPRFRRTLIAKMVVEHAIAICRRKGYTKMYGHAQKRLVSLWERFGFETMNKNTQLVFSDHEYVEMLGEIAPHDAPLTPFSDPYVLIRPEGRWDVPGVLDRSSERLATNPQRDRLAAASAA